MSYEGSNVVVFLLIRLQEPIGRIVKVFPGGIMISEIDAMPSNDNEVRQPRVFLCWCKTYQNRVVSIWESLERKTYPCA